MAINSKKRILILGVGNVLLRDEGVGIRVLQELESRYEFTSNIRLVDGGVLGLSLIGSMIDADHIIIIDAIRGNNEPGSLYHFDWEHKPHYIQFKDSLHQIDLTETIAILPLICVPPKVTIIGVEYEDIDNWGLELTPKVEQAVESLVLLVLTELERLGCSVNLRINPQKIQHVFSYTSQNS